VYELQLERVLTKLKFDESVSGYALVTADGHPFLSFSLPDEVLPQIKGTLKIHGSDLRLVNIMTDKGTVILARVDPLWVLAVLFDPDFQLGGALSRTKAVVDLLVQVDLPPPPKFEDDEETPVPEPISMEAVFKQPAETPKVTHVEEPEVVPIVKVPEVDLEPAPAPEPVDEEEIIVQHGCVVHRAERYSETMSLDSDLNTRIKKEFSNVGIDILLIVDEKRTVYKIAEHLSRPVEKVIEIVSWCASNDIVSVECPDVQEPTQKEIIELPLFEGNIDKVKKKHRAVIELCNGKRTLQEIATEVGIPYFEALQTILPYRGKTLKIIRTDKESRF
jgi:predicted regulator of Ras-like GTPase activity (Roadblock/LC7/MglB family)